MIEITDDQFDELINEALASLPGEHIDRVANVAILHEDDPTPDQRQELRLRDDQSLFGLYEGTPLSRRQGRTDLIPDRITLFKHPLSSQATTIGELRERIRHTLWHEIGHYYGLNHEQIYKLER